MTLDTKIHPLAVVEPGAKLGVGVTVGPFCTIGAHVELGDHSALISHVSLAGRTRIGSEARIFPFASIGHIPQDLKYHGEESTLEIGDKCMIREGVTMNPGTEGGGMITRVGHHCTFLANAHVAHDCVVGNHVIFSNNVMLAGHCQVGDYAILGGGAAVHQFCRIGAHAFIGGLSGVENDVIPYGIALGNRAHLAGLNMVGLKRRGFSREAIQDIRRAYRLLFAEEGTLQERIEDVATDFADDTIVVEILDFLRSVGNRSVCTPRDSKEG